MKLLIVILIHFSVIRYVYPQTDSLFISSAFGEFSDAASISSSRGEFIFVSDVAANEIYKFDLNGKKITAYGGTGLGSYALNRPVSIDASNGLDVFVCDNLNNRIVRLDYKLNFISIFDFNYYNNLAETPNKIFNPLSAASISTGELIVLCDAGNYKAVRLREFNDINLYFGQATDRIAEPVKIVRGSELDIWILDKSANELLNFNNLGIFVKRVKLTLNPVSITYAEGCIIILSGGFIYVYDTVRSAFTASYFIPSLSGLRDINMAEKESLFILRKNQVLKFSFKFN